VSCATTEPARRRHVAEAGSIARMCRRLSVRDVPILGLTTTTAARAVTIAISATRVCAILAALPRTIHSFNKALEPASDPDAYSVRVTQQQRAVSLCASVRHTSDARNVVTRRLSHVEIGGRHLAGSSFFEILVGCCNWPYILCGGVCVDPWSDRNNCGGCGTVCPETAPYCLDGICGEPPCVPGLTLCGDTCVNLMTDLWNCVACGLVCNDFGFEACIGGVCQNFCNPCE
jgi:hypothetical protein